MRKLTKLILILFLACGVVSTIPQSGIINEASAVSGSYPLFCGSQYEVATVNNDGSFSKMGCYGDFYSARSAMESAGDDAVVRHSSSYSATGIIAINSGIAISYPMRSGSTTMNISAYVDGGGKTTYVTKHREMFSVKTENYDGNGNGKVYVQLNGFSGYVDLKLIDLVPMKYISNNISIQLGGNDTTSANEQPFWTKVIQDYYTVEQNGNYRDLVYHGHSGYDATEWSWAVGLAADWMTTGSTYYSWDNYRFYNDRKFSSMAGTYYNYYQFLPTRSQSNIPSWVYNTYLSNLGFTSKPSSSNINSLTEHQTQLWNEGQTFIDAQNTYGINALLVFSMACLESGNGRSSYAVGRNNLFGWTAYDSNPDAATYFSSIPQAIQEHMGINLRGYTDIMDSRFFGSHLGNKGSGFNVKYAADPYWGAKIAAIAYQIDKISKNWDGSLTDYNALSLGVINTASVNVKKDASSSSTTLYNTTYGNGYQENFTVVMLTQDSNWTKIQSTNGINADGTLVTHRTNGASTGTNLNGLIGYDFTRSIGYLPTSQVTAINSKGVNAPVANTPTGDFVSTLSEFSVSEGKLSIKGQAYWPGITVNNDNQAVQKIQIVDEYYEKVETSLSAGSGENYSLNFEGEVDLSKLALGNYYFKVVTEYSKTSDYNHDFVVNYATLPAAMIYQGRKYEFSNSDGITWLQISKTVEEEVSDTDEVTMMIRQSLSSMKYSGTNLQISGVAFINGMDAKADSKITHTIVLQDMSTKEKIEYAAVTENESTPINIFDGFEYTRAKFSASIDVSTLKASNYVILLRVKNGDTTLETPLYSIKTSLIPATIVNNGYNIKITQNPTYSYRYEISIEKNMADLSVVSKPTRRDSAFSYDSISMNEKTLKFNAMAWIQEVSFADEASTVHQMMLVDESGTIIKVPTTTKACSIDYATMMGSQYSMKNICFDSEVTLNTLAPGEYRVYMDLKTKDYHDIYELSYYRALNVNSITIDTKTYQLVISPVRNRLLLTVTSNE